jgi:hypothetical protein
MPDPLRLRVLKALTTALEEITPENYFEFDLTDAVLRGRLIYGDGDPLPMLSIIEPPIAPDQLPQPQDGTESNGEWELLIQGFVKDDKKHPTDPAHALMAEVKMKLAEIKQQPETSRFKTGEAEPILGIRAITRLNIGAGVVRPPDEISAKAYFWLNITLGLAEDLLTPYDG